MMIALFAVAIAGAVPEPAQILHLREVEYPKDALVRNMVGPVRVQATVTPAGSIIDCVIVSPRTSPILGGAACAAMVASTARAARDEAGAKVYGVITQTFTFITPGSASAAPPPTDLSLVVSRMPDGAGLSETRNVVVRVDATGKALNCWGNGAAKLERLDTALCSMVMHRLTFHPVKDEQGQPVVSIRWLFAEFSTAQAPLSRQ